MIKKLCLFLLINVLCINTFVFANPAESEYIVTIPTDMPVLFSAGNTLLEPVVNELGIYKCSADDLDTVKKLYGEASVEPNQKVRLYDLPEVVPNDNFFRYQWNLKMINMPESWYYNKTGKTTRIAIIDSGVDSSNPDLENIVVAKKDYTNSANGLKDEQGHGTSVANVAAGQSDNSYGIAGVSQAEIVSLKVFSTVGNLEWVIKAIYDAVDTYNCDVINMSLGVNQSSTALKNAVNYAISKGAIVVASAGNYVLGESGTIYSYPASYDDVISVASVDENGNHASHSYTNNKVDVAAPGSDIITLVVDNRQYYSGSGTSYASPHIAGAAAIMKGIKPSLTCKEFMNLIKATATDTESVGYDTKTGYGIFDIAKMMETLLAENDAVEMSRVKINNGNLSFKCKNFSASKAISATHIFGTFSDEILTKAYLTPFKLNGGEEKYFSYNGVNNEYKSFFLDNQLDTIVPIGF